MHFLNRIKLTSLIALVMIAAPSLTQAAAKPIIGVPGPTTAIVNSATTYSANIRDQSGSGIAYCRFYVDNDDKGAMTVYGDLASMSYVFADAGVHTIFVFCKDNLNGMQSSANASVTVNVPVGTPYTPPVVQPPGFGTPSSPAPSTEIPPPVTTSAPIIVVNQNPGLVKISCPAKAAADHVCRAVYYHGTDDKRHPFPNQKVYSTWYADFSGVKEMTSETMSAITLGKPVLYRPGVRLVKFSTLPKVYAVGVYGELRWIQTEAIARALYGDAWDKIIDEISDTFVIDYSFGADISSAGDFSPAGQTSNATSIDQNLEPVYNPTSEHMIQIF